MHRHLSVLILGVCLSGCGGQTPDEPVPFSIAVVPGEMNDTIPEQRCVLLVTTENAEAQNGTTGAVRVSASAPGATVEVEHEAIRPGEVAEVTVIPGHREDGEEPAAGDEGRTITATIRAERDGLVETTTVPLTVTSEEEDLVGSTAADMRDLFIPWLAENEPELGITEETPWTGTIVTPHILVVTHYLYFSDEWEMHVYWHVMIPPYDWAGIELRRRFVETAPSLAFKIPSRSATPPLEAVAIEPSETLWRSLGSIDPEPR